MLEGCAGGRSFLIRPVDPQAEESAILAVYRQCEDFLALGPQPRASLDMVRADLTHSREEGGLFCGIYAPTGAMLGVVDYVAAGYAGSPQSACLLLLMIAAPYRGSGLGAAVVRAVEADMRERGNAARVLSGVQANNPLAQRFWRRMGYRIVSGAYAMPDLTVAYQLLKEL